MKEQWTRERLIDKVRNYQKACVLLTAADLNVFSILKIEGLSAEEELTRFILWIG